MVFRPQKSDKTPYQTILCYTALVKTKKKKLYVNCTTQEIVCYHVQHVSLMFPVKINDRSTN